MDLAELVGRNCRTIRGGASMAELAEHARKFGVRWNSGEVAKIEQGDRRPTVALLVILASALSSLHDGAVTVCDLLNSGTDPIYLTDTVQIANGAALAQILAGNATRQSFLPAETTLPESAEAALALAEPEQRIARSLNTDTTTFAAWSLHLWGRSFAVERDERAGKYANAQQRGHVTRAMKQELRQAIAECTTAARPGGEAL